MSSRLINIGLLAAGAIVGGMGADLLLFEGSPEPAVEFAEPREASTAAAAGIRANRRSDAAEARRNVDSPDSIDGSPRLAVLDAVSIAHENDPEAALSAALAIDDPAVQRAALRSVARTLARRDPAAALARSARLPAAQRAEFQSAVAEEWAFADPGGFLEYARSADVAPLRRGFDVLIATDPDSVLEFTGSRLAWVNPAMFDVFISAATESIRRDPAAALAFIEPRATGRLRRGILSEVASAYAEIDDRAALAWARSLQPPLPEVVIEVIETIARTDMLRGLDLVHEVYFAAGAPPDRSAASVANMLARAASRSGQEPRAVLDALLPRADTELTGPLLGQVLGYWAETDAMAAVEWLASNSSSVDAGLVAGMVRPLALENPALAAELTNRVPPAMRASWMSGMAMMYGEFDPERALKWIEEYSGQPGYEAARQDVVASVTALNLPLAIRYMEETGATASADTLRHFSNQWARQDAEAAARWAFDLSNPAMQSAAMRGLVERWTVNEPAAAQRWVLDQPRGEARDRMLMAMLMSSALGDSLDAESLIAAFDSREAAQRSVFAEIERAVTRPSLSLGSVTSVTYDRELAIELLPLLSDPDLRARAERLLAAGE